jgi:hypothetical protein
VETHKEPTPTVRSKMQVTSSWHPIIILPTS